MNMSDIIEKMLLDMLKEADGTVEIQRNNLAGELNCVPSQINYVIQTRFTPERGYIIESRRGGGGGVRIRTVKTDATTYPMHIVNAVGNTLSYRTAAVFVQNLLDYNCITEREAHIILGAVNDKVLPFTADIRDTVRAGIFKSMLTSLMRG
ncbi:MAG: CtsR family transcriptional regulator [Ruminococcaceae bacterium]|nr:CtsR family transcriptional regulator [Oscillospiraceae bacterium]